MKSVKVLVVDDFQGFRDFVSSLLQPREEFRITQAFDGLEAVQTALTLQPDLILLDMGLPKLNGLEVARRTRKLAPQTKILFLSAESHHDLVREALNVGALGYVHKPRAQSELLEAIEAVLRGERFLSRSLEPDRRADAPGRHVVQFYSADSAFLENLFRFISTALKADDPAIVIATNAHRDDLFRRLKGAGFDLAAQIERGTLISLDAAGVLSTNLVNGKPDRRRFFDELCSLVQSATKASNKHHPRVAIFGECVDLLCAEGNANAAIQLEEIGNDLLEMHNADILCAYSLSSFPGATNDAAFKRICAVHTSVYPG